MSFESDTFKDSGQAQNSPVWQETAASLYATNPGRGGGENRKEDQNKPEERSSSLPEQKHSGNENASSSPQPERNRAEAKPCATNQHQGESDHTHKNEVKPAQPVAQPEHKTSNVKPCLPEKQHPSKTPPIEHPQPPVVITKPVVTTPVEQPPVVVTKPVITTPVEQTPVVSPKPLITTTPVTQPVQPTQPEVTVQPQVQHIALPPVEMPSGNYFQPVPPKPDVPTISKTSPVQPGEQTTLVVGTPIEPGPVPPDVFSGIGKGHGTERIVKIVAPDDQITSSIEIPRLHTGKMEVQPTGTVAENPGTKIPPSIDRNAAIPPPNYGAVGEWHPEKIPFTGKKIDIAHGPLGDKKGPFGDIDKLKQGDIIVEVEHGARREYKVTEVDTIKRNDHEAWTRAFAPVPKGEADQAVLVTCAGDLDKNGLHVDRTVVYAEAVDGKSTQKNITEESKFGRTVTTSGGNDASPENSAEKVIVPPARSSALGTPVSIGVTATSGHQSKERGEVSIGTEFGKVSATINDSIRIDKDISLVNTDKTKIFVTPGLGYNAGYSYDSGSNAAIVGTGASLDLSVTAAQRLNDKGAAVFARAGGSWQPTADNFREQWFGQVGAETPISNNIKLMGGIGVQGASSDASKGVVADTSVGPFAKITYDINSKTNLSLQGQTAGGSSELKLQTEFHF